METNGVMVEIERHPSKCRSGYEPSGHRIENERSSRDRVTVTMTERRQTKERAALL